VLGTASQTLDVGRQARPVTGPLRRALVLRDRGCAFPGCDRPPRWTDAHHIQHWSNGGPTAPNGKSGSTRKTGSRNSCHRHMWTPIEDHDETATIGASDGSWFEMIAPCPMCRARVDRLHGVAEQAWRRYQGWRSPLSSVVGLSE
jgi:hypothetical protein